MAEAKKRNWKLNCAVLDSGAHLVSFKRMDGGAIASISIAMHKARTAVKFRRDTKILELASHSNPYIATLDDVIASRGGLPIIDQDKLIGGIGCSGGTGSQDELVAKAGLAAVGKLAALAAGRRLESASGNLRVGHLPILDSGFMYICLD